MAALTPQVFWAQRHTEIYLRVELSDATVGQSPANRLLKPGMSCSDDVLNVHKLYFMNAPGCKVS